MRVALVGIGEGGSNMVDDLTGRVKEVERERDALIIPKVNGQPAVFSINLGKPDLLKLHHIPQDEDHSILIGSQEFHGRGAGKINVDGAQQAKLSASRVIKTIEVNSGNFNEVDAIFLFASTAGGTGSGGVSVFGDALKNAYPKIPVYAVLILPFATDYDDPNKHEDVLAVVNTATCLNEVLNYSNVNATILVHNEQYVQVNKAAQGNFELINAMFANSMIDLWCAGEERQRRFIGQVMDASDMINTFHGVVAVASSYAEFPKGPPRIAGKRLSRRHFEAADQRNKAVERAISQALNRLSVECRQERDILDAGRILTMFIGSNEKTTSAMVDIVHDYVEQRIKPGKVVQHHKGTYPRALRNAIGAAVIVADIGEGAASELIQFFYDKAEELGHKVEQDRKEREKHWKNVNKFAANLPRLR